MNTLIAKYIAASGLLAVTWYTPIVGVLLTLTISASWLLLYKPQDTYIGVNIFILVASIMIGMDDFLAGGKLIPTLALMPVIQALMNLRFAEYFGNRSYSSIIPTNIIVMSQYSKGTIVASLITGAIYAGIYAGLSIIIYTMGAMFVLAVITAVKQNVTDSGWGKEEDYFLKSQLTSLSLVVAYHAPLFEASNTLEGLLGALVTCLGIIVALKK